MREDKGGSELTGYQGWNDGDGLEEIVRGRCEMSAMNLSFSGCGFLGIYHVGVASAFREYVPQICLGKIAGASAGSLAAAALACEVPLGKCSFSFMRCLRTQFVAAWRPGDHCFLALTLTLLY